MKGKARKVADFLLVRPAFSQRNMTTLLLVAMFVGVYTLAGGKVTLRVPDIDVSDSQFGGVPGAALGGTGSSNGESEAERAARVLGMKETEEANARENAVNARGKLFDPAVDADPSDSKLDRNGLLGNDSRAREDEEAKLRKFEKHKSDSLAAIEERLNINRAGKK